MVFILTNADAATRASTDETEGCQLDCISCNWSKKEKESGFTRIWIRDRGMVQLQFMVLLRHHSLLKRLFFRALFPHVWKFLSSRKVF